jgi:glycosyltransferase involved in cell wall biosynthesis
MEAMACSRAVVAFKTGGIPEMIAHQETGWLSDTGYEQGLTEGIAWLYEQKDTNVAGLAARIRAEALYSPRIVAEQYLKIYTSFLNS